MGSATITDNRPLSDLRLASVLDDGLAPDDWRLMLAERVFFWTVEADLRRLQGARLNSDRPRTVFVFDTLSLARDCAARMDISPLKSGATIHQPPCRGLATYAPLLSTDWEEWRRRRGRSSPDRIKEVTVRGPVPEAARHLVDVRHTAVA